jgi:hypothetical protein
MIRLRISTDGRIRSLWNDEVRLGDLGVLHVRRASHVEFDESRQCWCVCAAQDPDRILHRNPSRTAALAWEQEHFGPGGPGWDESRACTAVPRRTSGAKPRTDNKNMLNPHALGTATKR